MRDAEPETHGGACERGVDTIWPDTWPGPRILRGRRSERHEEAALLYLSKLHCVVLSSILLIYSFSPAHAELPPGTFRGLGQLPSDTPFSEAWSISGDGGTAAGFSFTMSGSQAIRWTESEGMSLLMQPAPGSSGYATGVNHDGSVIVGGMSGNFPDVGFRWTAEEGAVPLHAFSFGNWSSFAWDVSADGGTVVGAANFVSSLDDGVPFIWTQDEGMRLISVAGTGYSEGTAIRVSGDGRIVVGNLSRPYSTLREAFYWSDEDGLVKLGGLYSGLINSFAIGTSYDGSVIVGRSTSLNGQQAFRWTEAGGMQSLWEELGRPSSSSAYTTSADGSVTIGLFATDADRGVFVLDDQLGMRKLETILTNDFGVDLTGWRLIEPVDVSADGRTIVGWGRNPEGSSEAWIAVIPEPQSAALVGVVSLVFVRRRWRRSSPC